MKHEDRIERWLGDLRTFASQAAFITSQGRDRYLEDSPDGMVLRAAGERILIRVATVAERLPAEFRDSHPGVEWVKIIRMRNLVAHQYERVNDDLLWVTLSTDIPALIVQVDERS
ncbi:MAG: DUF86 domain-containing protein [Actinomycetia bacterium]|nr:DUF86 domain-containing protein [Actinomycetes bacterium]